MSEFADSFHQITTSIITQLIAFLQMKFHGNDQGQTPFTTHPTTMILALSSFIVYYLLHVLLLRSPRPGRFAAVAERFLVWSGYAAVATLAAAVFPQGASPFLYAIFGLLSASEVLYMCDEKLVNEDAVEIKDDDVVEIKDDDVAEIGAEVNVEEGEGSIFHVYRRHVCLCLKHLCFGRVAKFFHKQLPTIQI